MEETFDDKLKLILQNHVQHDNLPDGDVCGKAYEQMCDCGVCDILIKKIKQLIKDELNII